MITVSMTITGKFKLKRKTPKNKERHYDLRIMRKITTKFMVNYSHKTHLDKDRPTVLGFSDGTVSPGWIDYWLGKSSRKVP